MNAQEFEKEVRELRQRQRRFFHCRKDDPDRPKALELMRSQEKLLLPVIEAVMALRPIGKKAGSDREEFFLLVADMMRKQKEWVRQGGGSWQMSPARETERLVDKWLSRWDEERKAEERQRKEELARRQPKLF